MLRHVVQLLSPLVYRVRMVNALKHFAPPFAPSSLAMPRPFRHRDSQRRESLHDEASGAQRYDPVRPGHINVEKTCSLLIPPCTDLHPVSLYLSPDSFLPSCHLTVLNYLPAKNPTLKHRLGYPIIDKYDGALLRVRICFIGSAECAKLP